jgi:high-affinity iron transporter
MLPKAQPPQPSRAVSRAETAGVGLGVVALLLFFAWAAVNADRAFDPTGSGVTSASAIVDISVLVFREGLECVLVLAAITASMVGSSESLRRPIGAGVVVAFGATLVTWWIAVRLVDRLTESIPALHVQALTGLLAIVVLLVVMNWFFHKVYWSGWISLHTKRKRDLLERAESGAGAGGVRMGLIALGFTSFYREGFEVVLFLQSYRLRLGLGPVLYGVTIGAALALIVAALTFVAHHRLPYKKMLVATGVLLGIVLLVMVGEEAQEMQLAGWLSQTPAPGLGWIPPWAGLWFAVFPTVETLTAQAIAAALVIGSYAMVNLQLARTRRVTA